MRMTLPPVIGLSLAALFGFFALVIWYALLREVPEQKTEGIIKNAYLADEQVLERRVPRSHRNLEHVPLNATFVIPERYVYVIELASTGEQLNFSNMSPDLDYKVGGKVDVVYLERSLPLVWKKKFIHSVMNAK